MFKVSLPVAGLTWMLQADHRKRSIAMGMRRPNLVQPSSHTGDCLKALETSEDALPSDRILCRWVELQRLADQFAAQASAEEDSEISVEARDARTRIAHAQYTKQVSEWEARNSSELRSSKLSSTHISLCIHRLGDCLPIFRMRWLTSR